VQRVVPALRIRDYARSRRFWVEALGFEIDWEWRDEPGMPVFAQISRAGLSLYLTEHAGDGEPGGLVYLYVSDVDAWHEEVRRAGLEVDSEPANRPWGNREMGLRDPDGNRIVLATVLPR
jgi:catechol 2,3-dioxygenase-like lactoylglutathione lyase family enzyme